MKLFACAGNALVIGFLEGGGEGGGGGPRAVRIVHFKVLVFPHPLGIFFLESPVFGEAKHATGFEDALQNFSSVL